MNSQELYKMYALQRGLRKQEPNIYSFNQMENKAYSPFTQTPEQESQATAELMEYLKGVASIPVGWGAGKLGELIGWGITKIPGASAGISKLASGAENVIGNITGRNAMMKAIEENTARKMVEEEIMKRIMKQRVMPKAAVSDEGLRDAWKELLMRNEKGNILMELFK